MEQVKRDQDRAAASRSYHTIGNITKFVRRFAILCGVARCTGTSSAGKVNRAGSNRSVSVSVFIVLLSSPSN
jgi:hypothetical protein